MDLGPFTQLLPKQCKATNCFEERCDRGRLLSRNQPVLSVCSSSRIFIFTSGSPAAGAAELETSYSPGHCCCFSLFSWHLLWTQFSLLWTWDRCHVSGRTKHPLGILSLGLRFSVTDKSQLSFHLENRIPDGKEPAGHTDGQGVALWKVHNYRGEGKFHIFQRISVKQMEFYRRYLFHREDFPLF